MLYLLEFEYFHLDLQADSSINFFNKWRMKIQTKKKTHRNMISIAQEFTVSFTIIISSVTIVYIGRIRMHGI